MDVQFEVRESVRARFRQTGTHYCTGRPENASLDWSGVLALLIDGDRRIRESLQFDNGRRAVGTPEVHDVTATGKPARQGQDIGLSGLLMFCELDLERDLVTTKLCGFLIEMGGFGARGIQLAAQFAIAGLQHLKEPDVLKTFGM